LQYGKLRIRDLNGVFNTLDFASGSEKRPCNRKSSVVVGDVAVGGVVVESVVGDDVVAGGEGHAQPAFHDAEGDHGNESRKKGVPQPISGQPINGDFHAIPHQSEAGSYHSSQEKEEPRTEDDQISPRPIAEVHQCLSGTQGDFHSPQLKEVGERVHALIHVADELHCRYPQVHYSPPEPTKRPEKAPEDQLHQADDASDDDESDYDKCQCARSLKLDHRFLVGRPGYVVVSVDNTVICVLQRYFQAINDVVPV
jgi:hypothetical protein